MENKPVKLYLAIWIFYSRKDKVYHYTKEIITPFLNFDYLSKSEIHVRRAMRDFGENNLTLTNQFNCFKGNTFNEEETCVKGIIYTRYIGESNLNKEECMAGHTFTPPQMPTPEEESPFKEDSEIESSIRIHPPEKKEVVKQSQGAIFPVLDDDHFDWESF